MLLFLRECNMDSISCPFYTIRVSGTPDYTNLSIPSVLQPCSSIFLQFTVLLVSIICQFWIVWLCSRREYYCFSIVLMLGFVLHDGWLLILRFVDVECDMDDCWDSLMMPGCDMDDCWSLWFVDDGCGMDDCWDLLMMWATWMTVDLTICWWWVRHDSHEYFIVQNTGRMEQCTRLVSMQFLTSHPMMQCLIILDNNIISFRVVFGIWRTGVSK